MTFRDGPVDGVIWTDLKFYNDHRGWLCEFFRHDDLDPAHHPVMAYMSMTRPGISRGPHEHVDQTDYFCFIGPSQFKVCLWDARSNSPTYGHRDIRIVGAGNPFALVIPPGVVHAYKNAGDTDGWVFNGANRLYKGWNRQEPVDEIRHEEQKDSPYQLD